ncbi:MAG: hypothetical protein V1646_03210 [bacterium]
MKMNFLGFYYVIFSIFFISIFNSAKPNRSRVKFLDDNVFLFTHCKSVYMHDIRDNTQILYYKLTDTGVIKDIFSLHQNDINISIENSIPDYFITLPEIQKFTLDKYEKASYDRLFITRNGKTLVTIKTPFFVQYFNADLEKPIENDFSDIIGNDGLSADELKYNLRDIDATDDGRVVVLNFYRGGKLCTWFPRTNKIHMVSSGLGGEYFFNFALSPNGERLFSISSGGELWNIQSDTFEFIFRWDEHINDYDVQKWVTPQQPEELRQFYYRTNTPLFYLPIEKAYAAIKKALFSENSNFLFLLISLEKRTKLSPDWIIKIFDIQKASFIKTIPVKNLLEYPEEMAISPDGKNLIIIDRDAKVITTQIDN